MEGGEGEERVGIEESRDGSGLSGVSNIILPEPDCRIVGLHAVLACHWMIARPPLCAEYSG